MSAFGAPTQGSSSSGRAVRAATLRHPASLRSSRHFPVPAFVACDSPCPRPTPASRGLDFDRYASTSRLAEAQSAPLASHSCSAHGPAATSLWRRSPQCGSPMCGRSAGSTNFCISSKNASDLTLPELERSRPSIRCDILSQVALECHDLPQLTPGDQPVEDGPLGGSAAEPASRRPSTSAAFNLSSSRGL
jgi:hypothetical protein